MGDSCLLFSGLFPKIAEKRSVSIGYYVGIGQSAYQHLAESCRAQLRKMFHEIAGAFVRLMDVLQAIRSFNQINFLTPLELCDLYRETGSEQALKSIQQKTLSTPVFDQRNIKH